MGEVLIGTCGFTSYDPPSEGNREYESSLAAFASDFDLVEVERTFHSLPDVETVERWLLEATEANPSFTFTARGWQAITHPISSPTWRGADSKLTEAERERVGSFQPNQTVLDAWGRTKERVDALEAPVVVLETPPGFDCSDAHEHNVRQFVEAIDREGLEIAWEPRGDWLENLDRVQAICADCDLIHTTDPLLEDPVATTDVAYLRLHGRNADVADYDYSYDEDELTELAERCEELAADHERVFCLFSNYDMYENAGQFASILA